MDASQQRILGIDPSTKSGVVVVSGNGDLIDSKIITFPDARGFKRLQLIAKSFHSIVTHHNPSLIVIEGYAYGNAHTLVTLVEIGTIIRHTLFSHGLSWYDVPPSKLKKFTTGKGNAKKDEMAVHVKDRWGFTSKSNDVVDAYALAQLGRMIALQGVPKEIGALSCEDLK